jgi:hypothetical protein
MRMSGKAEAQAKIVKVTAPTARGPIDGARRMLGAWDEDGWLVMRLYAEPTGIDIERSSRISFDDGSTLTSTITEL